VVIVEFALLGDVRAWHGGRDVDLGTPGQRAMLALLLLGEGRQICIEELIDRMWGADPPPSARVTARTYISRLRRSLAEAAGADAVIESTAGGYCLPGVADRLDLAVFQRRTEAARVGENSAAAAIALRGALELWRGTALSGAHGVFVEQERERLEQLRLAALEERIKLELELGQHAVLVAELSGLANAHPLRERAHELLMLSLYRAGRQADALAAYQNIRNLLAEKLGIDPGPSLRALHHQILRSAPELAAPRCPAPLRLAAPGAATSPVPAQLPADIPDFTGRDEQIDWLRSVLERTDRPNIAGIGGLDGVGKTTLAVHAAHLLRERFPDGQIFVDLGAASGLQADPFTVLGRLLRVIGVPTEELPDTLEERAALWRSLLSERRVLVVLDDAGSGAQVRPLLPAGPGAAAIVTSSRRMDAIPAISWRTLPAMPPDQAARFLASIVGDDRCRAEPRACQRLLAVCSGHPLAVRVMAARILTKHKWTIEEITRQFDEEIVQPDCLHEDQRLMSLPIRRAHARLDPATAHAFQLAAVPNVSAICPDSAAALLGITRTRATATLDTLIDAHLLEALPDGAYGYPALTRTVARREALAQDRGSHRAALERLRKFYLCSERNARAAIANAPGGPPRQGGNPADGLTFRTADSAHRWLARTRTDRQSLLDQIRHEADGSPKAAS